MGKKSISVDIIEGGRLFILKNHVGAFEPGDLVTCNAALLKITLNPIQIQQSRVRKFLVTHLTVQHATRNCTVVQ